MTSKRLRRLRREASLAELLRRAQRENWINGSDAARWQPDQSKYYGWPSLPAPGHCPDS